MPDLCDKSHLGEIHWKRDGEKKIIWGLEQCIAAYLNRYRMPTLGGLNGYVSGILISS